MDPDRWVALRRLFEEALEVDPRHREALLRERSGGDEDLLAEARALLSADARSETPLDAGPPSLDDLRVARFGGDEEIVGIPDVDVAP